MPLPYILNNLVSMYKKGGKDKRSADAFDELATKMMQQYNDPGMGDRPVDPGSMIDRGKAVGLSQGPQDALKYLLKESDPARLAELERVEALNRENSRLSGLNKSAYDKHMASIPQLYSGEIPGIDKSLAGPLSMMAPDKASQNILDLHKMQKGSDINTTSDILNSKYFSGLDEQGKQEYLKAKRATQLIDEGGGLKTLSPSDQVVNLISPEQSGTEEGREKSASEEQVRKYEANVSLPSDQRQAQSFIDVLDNFEAHPGFDSAYGASTYIPAVRGSVRADAESLRSQIEGKSFLQAFRDLKGGGSITEMESAKASAAISTINDPTQSSESARKAAETLRQMMRDQIEANKASAKATYSPSGKQTDTGGSTIGRFTIREN